MYLWARRSRNNIQPGEELWRSPVSVRSLPITISPDDVRLVGVHELLDLREVVLVDVLGCVETVVLIVQVEGVEPLKQRIVSTEGHVVGANGVGEITEEITVRTNGGSIPVPGVAGREVGETFVVLGGEDDVLGSRLLEHFGPAVRVVHLGLEHGGEVLVLEVLSIGLLMEFDIFGGLVAVKVLPRHQKQVEAHTSTTHS